MNETITVEAAAPMMNTTRRGAATAVAVDKGAASPVIVLEPWNPETPYLDAIRKAGPGAYAEFLRQRALHGNSPAFFLDSADYFLDAGDRSLALRILTDIAELRLEEPALLRVLAHRLQQIGELDLAVAVFETVLRLRPEEPQSKRDLAGALADRADRSAETSASPRASALADYERALELLNDVIVGVVGRRFRNIELFAIEESNRILARVERAFGPGKARSPMDARFRKNLDTDLRIVLTWDTDNTDMDLWVIEPSNEEAMYSHQLTTIGGMVSDDFTDGYGPEAYQIRKAMLGKYRIQADYFGSRAQTLTGPTTLQATIFTDFGRATEKRRAITIRLRSKKDRVDIGEVQMGSAPTPTNKR